MLTSLVSRLPAAPAVSPQQREKDRAVYVARDVLRGNYRSQSWEDASALARQFLRALALPE